MTPIPTSSSKRAVTDPSLVRSYRTRGANSFPRPQPTGGYDERVPENVEHLSELRAVAAKHGVEGLVQFRTNIADGEKTEKSLFGTLGLLRERV